MTTKEWLYTKDDGTLGTMLEIIEEAMGNTLISVSQDRNSACWASFSCGYVSQISGAEMISYQNQLNTRKKDS